MADCLYDQITDQEIPPENLVRLIYQDSVFCFDIRTLARIASTSGTYTNPFTMQPLPSDVVDRINQYNTSRNIDVIIDAIPLMFTINRDESIASMIIQIYRSMGELQNIGNHRILMNGNDIYDMDITSNIGSITDASSIYLSMDEQGDRGMRMYNLYQYGLANHMDWLEDIIPERYRSLPAAQLPDEIDQAIITDMIQTMKGKGDIPEEYILRIFTRLLSGSKISARFAQHIQKILSRRISNAQSTDTEGRWDDLLHLLYSRVVDPYNLSSDGIQGIYRQSRVDPITYQMRNITDTTPQVSLLDEMMRLQREQFGEGSPDASLFRD